MEQERPASDRVILRETLFAFCVEAMVRSGMSREVAQTTADVLVTADLWGVHTHGTKQLFPLLKNLFAGRLSARASPEVIAQGPAWALVDGHDAMPPVAAVTAMRVAIDKARSAGIAHVGVRHSSHFAIAGYYANLAAEEDMIGMAMCNTEPVMTVPGARGNVIGTNPIAYAVPADQERPLLLDMATSTVAWSKVLAAKARGTPIPDTWLIDEQGLPTTDVTNFPAKGALLPMAGHKGYGLAVLVEVLTSVLTGAGMLSQVQSWTQDLPEPTNEGHWFMAIDVGLMMPLDEFKRRMDWMIREIKGAPLAQGAERIYLPGEMEWEKYDRALKQGITLPGDVVAQLARAAELTGARSRFLDG